MELVGQTLRDRLVQALVVFAVLLVLGYVRNDIDWVFLGGTTALFFVISLGLDALWARYKE
ncbi:hypothetical protein Halru_0369 [Halovivax ruber XH-70]|uniref:Uncharacterized protein n=1 Tax=Halovivax ruber (strain DSM 18193 / JCM 13892 / XH-70) TaxID=797302 RepID=L0IAN1_HALRX|nr:hypothetical protein [Halovivax ruber]AGB15012.1 hypothetical protein Halru_0369 [Halovivax ruber XH-70]